MNDTSTGNLTYDKLKAMARMFDSVSRFNGVRVISSKFHPKHPTRTYKAIFKAHPLVTRLCWALRRWIRIRPWIEAHYPDDADSYYLRDQNVLIMGERHYKLLQRQTKAEIIYPREIWPTQSR